MRPFALAAVAEAFAGAGLWEHAERTAHAIDPMYAAAGARALRSVVVALAAAGQWDRAEQTARAVPDIWEKTAAMASVGSRHDRTTITTEPLGLLQERRGARSRALPDNEATPNRSARPAGHCQRSTGIEPPACSPTSSGTPAAFPYPTGKDSALVGIARALADLHDWEQADRVAASLAGPSFGPRPPGRWPRPWPGPGIGTVPSRRLAASPIPAAGPRR